MAKTKKKNPKSTGAQVGQNVLCAHAQHCVGVDPCTTECCHQQEHPDHLDHDHFMPGLDTKFDKSWDRKGPEESDPEVSVSSRFSVPYVRMVLLLMPILVVIVLKTCDHEQWTNYVKNAHNLHSMNIHEYLSSNVTSNLLTFVSGLLPGYVTYLTEERLDPEPPEIPTRHPMNPNIDPSQRGSLLEPFSLDYELVGRLREENMKHYSYNYSRTGVDKRSKLSLQEFWDVYDGKWPVIITDVVPQWRASNWTRSFFVERYGKQRVTMKAVDSTLDKAVSLALPMEVFYQNKDKAAPNYWTYIEDELFIPMRPELKADIGSCPYLREDYFKLWPRDLQPWDAMLLWGTRYSRSSLHMDPYNWTGTNAVITGHKHWKLYPPVQDPFLYIKGGQHSGFPLETFKYNSPIDGMEPDMDQYPAYQHTHVLTADQLAGELLIIPTGWYHQAYNMEETFAVSGQTMNRHNFRVVLEEVLKAGGLPRTALPPNIDALPPREQVSTVMSLLPKSVLARGAAVTKAVLEQIEHTNTDFHPLR